MGERDRLRVGKCFRIVGQFSDHDIHSVSVLVPLRLGERPLELHGSLIF